MLGCPPMSRALTAVLLSVFAAFAPAQTVVTSKIQIRLSYSDGSDFLPAQGTPGTNSESRSAGTGDQVTGTSTALQIRVQLQDAFGSVVEERSPNSDGTIEFKVGYETRGRAGSTPGITATPAYRVRVFGPEIEEAMVDGVDPFHGETHLEIPLRRKSTDAVKGGKPSGAMVSLARLKVPDKARKELDKGNDLLRDKDFSGAEARFRKAIEIFPDYDQAYNNLGVLFMQTGKPDDARQNFQKAIAINDKFARAYTNLGKLDILEKKYDEGDQLLRKSIQADPTNAETFALAAQCAYFTKHYEDAVTDARQLHALPHGEFGYAHFLAARSLEQLQRSNDAAAEYKLFLKESPSSPNAPSARAALARLTGQ